MSQPISKHRLTCPRCGSFFRIRNSEQKTPKYREAYGICSNVDCNETWVLGIEFFRRLETWRPEAPAELDEEQQELVLDTG